MGRFVRLRPPKPANIRSRVHAMKLRLKIDGDASVYRIEVEATCTVEALQLKAVQVIPALADVPASSLALSLNKKDTLMGGDAAFLQQQGVCGGDTLWVMLPEGVTTPAGMAAHHQDEANGNKRTRQNGGLPPPSIGSRAAAAADAPVAAAAAARAPAAVASCPVPAAGFISGPPARLSQPDDDMDAEEPRPSGLLSVLKATETAAGSDATGGAGGGGATPEAEASADAARALGEEDPGCWADGASSGQPDIPLHLKRVLSAAARSSSRGGGAAGLGGPWSAHSLLLAAVHAAMLETGFAPLQDISLDLHRALPVSRLLYAWASGVHAGCVPPPKAAAAAAAAGCVPLAAGATASGRGSNICTGEVAAHPSAGSPPPSPLPNVCILASTTGPFLTLHASVAALPPSADMYSPTAPPSGSTRPSSVHKGVQGRTAAIVQTLHLDTSEHLDVAALLLQGGSASSGGVFESGDGVGAAVGTCFRDVPRLWLGLKEGVAAWLLSRCFQEAGLPPPVGLLMLPREVQDKILALLQARDLARVAVASSELRNLAGTDELWEPLYRLEFPLVPPTESEAEVSRFGGWRAAFAALWRRRAERRRLEDQAMRIRPRARTDPFFRGPAPAPPGFRMPSNIIGGDYDRLPMLGQGVGFPLLGSGGSGGGGIFGGGGNHWGGGLPGGPPGGGGMGPFGGPTRGPMMPFGGRGGMAPPRSSGLGGRGLGGHPFTFE